MTQLTLRDAATAETLKQEGLASVAVNADNFLRIMRATARRISEESGFVKVEIQEDNPAHEVADPEPPGRSIPGFTIEDCGEIIGDEIERVVRWKSNPEVSRLAGKPVRLRFVMKDADLFSLRFRG